MSTQVYPAIRGIPFVKADGTLTDHGLITLDQNFKAISTVDSVANEALKTYSFAGVVFSTVGNTVYWTEGQVIKTLGLEVTMTVLPAGSAEHTGIDLYLYYDEDTGLIQSTDSLVVALGSANRQVVATYKGSTDLIDGLNEPIIDGNKIIAGTIGANQLVTGSAVITGTAQIADAVIQSANIGDLTVERIKIANGAVSDSAAFSVFPSSGFAMNQVDDNINWLPITRDFSSISRQPQGLAFGVGTYVSVATDQIIYSTDGGATWTDASDYVAADYVAVIYANSMFVAVGGDGTVISTSPDGVFWTEQTGISSGSDFWYAITYGNGLFVVSGSAGIQTSPDGIVWTAQTPAAVKTWALLVFINGVFLATTNRSSGDNAAMTSSDGITWTSRTIGGTTAVNGCGAGNGKLFVLINGLPNDDLYSSTDGVTWTLVSTIVGAPYIIDKPFVFSPVLNRWFMVGYDGTDDGKYSDDDGVTWSTSIFIKPPISGRYNTAIVTDDGQFVYTYTDTLSKPYFSITDGVSVVPLSVGTNYSSVVWNGTDLFVAVGSGVSATSADGTTWVERNNFFNIGSFIPWSLTYGSGQFLAVTAGSAASSVDGVTWTIIGNPVSPRAIAYGASLFVALSNKFASGASVETSPDGINWTGRTIPGDPTLRGITYGNSLFVAVGSGGGNTVIIYSSPDGITWTSRLSSTGLQLRDVAWNGSLFVAVGYNCPVYTSPDGITWTARTNPDTTVIWESVTHGGGVFTAVGSKEIGTVNDKAMTSPDGITWTLRSIPSSGWADVVYGNSKFVAVAVSGNIPLATSPTGTTWTPVTTPSYLENDWTHVSYHNGLFVALSNSGVGNRVMTSGDGQIWQSRVSPQDNDWQSVTYGNGLYVAVAASGTNRVMTSPDGVTWTLRTASQANPWQSVTFGNGVFVAVATTGTNRVMTSPDGVTWTNRTASQANPWQHVAFGNGLFVAVAQSGTNRVMTSPDGVTWTNRTAAGTTDWKGVVYGNGVWVAVGSPTSGSTYIMSSPDGVTWTARTAPGGIFGLSAVTYANGLFITVGDSDDSITSINGTSWASSVLQPLPTYGNYVTIAGGAGIFVTLSAGGAPVMFIDTLGLGEFNTFPNDEVLYYTGDDNSTPSRLIVNPGLYGSVESIRINNPLVSGGFFARFITGVRVYVYTDETLTSRRLVAQRSTKTLECEWFNQNLIKSIGADQMESFVTPIVLNEDIDYAVGEVIAVQLVYSSYSTSPTQCSITRTCPGFGYIWSAFWK